MEPLFICPPDAALTAIPAQTCPERFDQIVKFFFQRKQASPSFDTTDILLQATWTPLIAASDATKIVKSPLVPNVIIPPGEVLKEGGNDNTTINGIPRLAGRSFVGVTANLLDTEAAVREPIRKLAAESALQPGFTNLWAYFVNRFGQIITIVDGTDCPGIPVYNVFVGDSGTEGLNKNNVNILSFDLEPGWSDKVKVLTPAFNPLNL